MLTVPPLPVLDKDRSVSVKPEDDPDVEQIRYKPADKPQNTIRLIVCNQRVNDRREIIDLSGYTDTFGSAGQNICQFVNCARPGESARTAGQQSVSVKIPIPSMDKSRARLGASGN